MPKNETPDRAAGIAIGTIAAFLREHPEIERVRMVCFDAKTRGFYEAALRRLEAQA